MTKPTIESLTKKVARLERQLKRSRANEARMIDRFWDQGRIMSDIMTDNWIIWEHIWTLPKEYQLEWEKPTAEVILFPKVKQ